MADYLNIAGRVRTTASDGVAMEAQEVKDLNINKSQQEINADVQTELGDRYTKEETYNRDQLNELITTPDVNRVYVIATNLTTAVTDLLPETGSSDTLYNVGNWDGTQYDTTVYSLYAWNGSAYVCLAVRSFVGEVYDISVNHPDGQGNPTPYADLTAALGTSGANIPADIRRGGMSIKFIQGTVGSSDNKYVQARCMAQNFTTDVTQWQEATDEPTENSKDLLTSGGAAEYYGKYVDNPEFFYIITDRNKRIFLALRKDGTIFFGAGVPPQIIKYINDKIAEFHVEDIVTFIGNLLNGDKTLQQLLNEKVDKETGKSLIQQDVADNLSFQNIPEYLFLELDRNRKILGGRKLNGNAFENMPLELPPVILGYMKNIGKRMEVTTDIRKRVISYRRDDGVLFENVGIESPTISKILNSMNILWEGSHRMNILTVKKDGSGDFTNIQEAINSISDASVDNQYEIQIFDDWYVNSLTDLWVVDAPKTHNITNTPDKFVAYIITKDFVHLRGVGGKREIYVENPNYTTTPSDVFPNIHNIFVIGNCRIENFVFKLKGGRYAMHQDKSANVNGVDSFKTTIYKDIDAINYGTAMYSPASSGAGGAAQANGIANGQTQIFINVTWTSYQGRRAFGMHSNEKFTLPCKAIFINCKHILRNQYQKRPGEYHLKVEDRYSCQNSDYFFFGCDIPSIIGRAVSQGSMADNLFTPPEKRYTKRYCLNRIIGYGNRPMIATIEDGKALVFKTTANGKAIEVVGGTAYEDIWGCTYKTNSGNGIKGTAIGGNYIVVGTYSQVHNLAYILGNCASSPKTLVVRVYDSPTVYTDYTIEFNKNYMTADGSSYSYNTTPYISQQDILDDINSEFSDYFTASDSFDILDTFIDCKELVCNEGEIAAARGSAMIKDSSIGYNCWRVANAGEKPNGFAAVDISIGGEGEVLLIEKNMFDRHIFNINNEMAVGTFYKVGSNGSLITTANKDDAILVSIDINTLTLI